MAFTPTLNSFAFFYFQYVSYSTNLRDRSHNYSLINKDSHINDRQFIVRLLYKHVY